MGVNVSEDYVYLDPRKPLYHNLGDIKGSWLHKELHKEFFSNEIDPTANVISKYTNDLLQASSKSGIEELNAHWKAFKTMWNVPGYWVRAWVGTAMMADMASDTNTLTLAKYYAQEVRHYFYPETAPKYKGKTLVDWAIQLGAGGTSMGEAELYAMRNNLKYKLKLNKLRSYENDVSNEKTRWGVKGKMDRGALWMAIASEKIGAFTKYLSDRNANMDLNFKVMLMRDFIENYKKQTKGTTADLSRLNEIQTQMLMEKAVAYAATGVPEYNINIPQVVQQARRAPLGAPFLTFNYKLAGMMSDSVVNRPWKFAKYPLLGLGTMTALLMANGMDGDDWDEAMKDMPFWAKNRTGIIPIPFKDDSGRISMLDLSYVIPPLFYVDIARNIVQPTPTESRIGNTLGILTEDIGLFGGIVPQIISASTTGIDPFTKRPIVSPGQNFVDGMVDRATWLYNLATIPALSPSGAAGDILRQTGVLPGQYTEFGTDKQSAISDVVSNLGFTMRDFKPSEQRKRNRKWIEYNKREVQMNISRIKKQMNSGNISREAGMKKLREEKDRLRLFERNMREWVNQ
jgi:hypothetical protein